MSALNKTLFRKTQGFFLAKVQKHVYQRRVLYVMDRDLSLPDPVIPQGKNSPMWEDEQNKFTMPLATHENIDGMAAHFPPSKLKILHNRVDDPAIDFTFAPKEDGSCWGYLMHAIAPYYEKLYNYTVDPGKSGVYQFDGWVNPHDRGRLVAILGIIFMFNRRRQEGYRRIRVIVWANDTRSLRLHKRFGFQEVQRLLYTRLGPFRWTRTLPRPTVD